MRKCHIAKYINGTEIRNHFLCDTYDIFEIGFRKVYNLQKRVIFKILRNT